MGHDLFVASGTKSSCTTRFNNINPTGQLKRAYILTSLSLALQCIRNYHKKLVKNKIINVKEYAKVIVTQNNTQRTTRLSIKRHRCLYLWYLFITGNAIEL